VPRVVGPIRRIRPVEVRDLDFLRRNTDHRIKITVPGPFTVTQQAQNDYYPVHMCFGYAAIVHDRPGQYAFLSELNDCVVQQISIETAQPNLDLSALQALPSKTILLGVLNLGDMRVETPDEIAARIRNALQYVEPERLIAAPDCGMKYLPRDVAFAKLQAMAQAAAIVRKELS
jgi:5-methyltetrahydropteroyltriglutamate--homocysteine methyltransferase